MIAKSLCAVLLLAGCCLAVNVPANDLNGEISKAKERITAITTSSKAVINELLKTMDSNVKYFNSSRDSYMKEALGARKMAIEKVNATARKYIGEAIDKNKNVNAFKCILKAKTETEAMIESGFKAYQTCADNTYKRITGEFLMTRSELKLIEESVVGLYQDLYNSLPDCKDSQSIMQLVHRAEMRENNLKKTMRTYEDRVNDFRAQFNQGFVDCSRNMMNGYNNAVKTCENKMKAC